MVNSTQLDPSLSNPETSSPDPMPPKPFAANQGGAASHWRWPPLLIVLSDPNIEIGLQLVDGTVHLFTKRDTVKFVEHGLVESLTDSIRLRALGLGTGVIDILDREVELILMPLWV